MAQDTLTLPTITTSGTTFAQFKTGGLKVILDNLVAVTANAAKANPTTQATVAVTSATGGLAAGTYFASYTFCDAFGETTVGTSVSASFTVTGLTQLATVTLPAKPTGVQAMNLYVTKAGGAAGSEYLFATGITGTSFALTDTLLTDTPAGAGVPATNTTGAAVHYQKLYSLVNGNPEPFLAQLSSWEQAYLGGAPMSRADIFRRHLGYYGVALAWSQVLKEAATLAWANQGTYTTTQGPIYATTKNVL